MANKDPYVVLGVQRGATDDEIKSAYRKLTKQYHPDLHPDDPSCAEKMSEVNAAYDQIKDADARRKYEDSQNVHPGYGYGYGSSPFGNYQNYGQNGYSSYTGYSGHGNYGGSGYYGSSGSSYYDRADNASEDDGDYTWVFTPFGAFRVYRGGSTQSQAGSYTNQSYTNSGYSDSGSDSGRSARSWYRGRRRIGLLRLILMFILINFLFRACTSMLFWGNLRTQANPDAGTQTERQYEMPGETQSF